MRVDRVILEAGDRSVTTEFHPRVTVVQGLDAAVGRDLATQLAQALVGDSDGMHVEVHADGRDLAVFRPVDEPHRVIDVNRARDVTEDYRAPDGRVDLLRGSGLTAARTAVAMHLSGPEIDVAGADGDAGHRIRSLALAVAVAALAAAALVAQSVSQIATSLCVAGVALLVGLVAGRRNERDDVGVDTDAIGGNIRAAQDSTALADPLPVIVTGLFETIPPRCKAAALDAAIRAGEGGQVVIVTDDTDVVDLARFREMAGEVHVVSPVVQDSSPA